jgi:hypothetical protein
MPYEHLYWRRNWSAADRLATDMRDFDRRLVRVETIIEITRPDGGTLRIAQETSEDKPKK